MTDSDVETGSATYIGNRRLRMDQELAKATRGRVQLVPLYIRTKEIKENKSNKTQQYVTSKITTTIYVC
jgi:hypothetical protein